MCQEQKKFDSIAEIFTALIEGKKVRNTAWRDDYYIHIDPFNPKRIIHNNGKEYYAAFINDDDFYYWVEYVDLTLKFSDLEVGNKYKRTHKDGYEFSCCFMVAYRTKEYIVCESVEGYSPFFFFAQNEADFFHLYKV